MNPETLPILQGCNGAILFRGRSKIDGGPIVAIATGFRDKTENRKTGRMIQTWILREDVDPVSASRNGFDSSTCGNCALRGIVKTEPNAVGTATGRGCYVNLAQAPLAVWKAYHAGRYVDLSRSPRSVLRTLFEGLSLRIGSYGDPAALPISLWREALRFASSWTGYTHDWRAPRSEILAPYVMASVESIDDAAKAQSLGWRTFRIRAEGSPLESNEIACPASDEARASGAKEITCEKCRLCRGASVSARSIAIVAHGLGSKHVQAT